MEDGSRVVARGLSRYSRVSIRREVRSGFSDASCCRVGSANIAEGFKRRGHKDKLHFYVIAQGSLEETRYYCILGFDPGYLKAADRDILMNRIEETSKLLSGLTKVMRERA